jgi:hypothetical protein
MLEEGPICPSIDAERRSKGVAEVQGRGGGDPAAGRQPELAPVA